MKSRLVNVTTTESLFYYTNDVLNVSHKSRPRLVKNEEFKITHR